MKYSLELSPRAKNALDKLGSGDFARLDPAILALANNPRPHGVKKLKEDIHRIRVGPWRVIYLVLDEERLVSVLEVVRRSKSTYKRYPA